MLADVNCNLLTLVRMSIHQDPLDEVVAVLVASDVDKRNSGTVCTSSGNDTEVAIQELVTADLETLLNNFGCELIDAVVVRVGQDVVDDTTLVGRRAVLAEVLDTPIAELTMSDEVDIVDHLLDSRALLLFNAVLEDVLNDQTASLSKSDLMPHAAKSFVDLEHDLRRLATPAELKQLLPNVTSVAVNDSVWDAPKQFPNHVSFVILRNGIEGLLDDVAAKWIHAQSDDVAVNGVSNSNDLLWCSMLEASLDEEVSETVDHEWVCLVDDGLDNLILLLCGADLELLLEEDRSLLVVVADDLIDNVLPIT